MSVMGLSDPEKFHKKPFHRRNDSGELDVFEAARYFSGGGEAAGFQGGGFPHQKVTREEKQTAWRGARISLDVPMSRNQSLPQQSHGVEKQVLKEKKHKQPSSPGGKLASFLNSLFSQTASKKKKKSKSATQSMKDIEEESPGGRRRRRSSISHFRSASTTDSKSIYSSSSSGFRTPPPYANVTPTKSYKDLRSYSDHKQVMSLSKYNGYLKSSASHEEALEHKRNRDSPVWLDEEFRFSNGISAGDHKCKNFCSGFAEKDRIWVDHKYPSEAIKELNNFNRVDDDDDDDDGAESDSSSDLFELQNYDLGYYSSDLPVYETTRMDSIKRGAPISNGPL
ncbi:protein BIG GRAIN 1-like E [Malania oleifera]|uniref:protein BIG GRAIN 1-like E n=1 Tax=Malania oleifera TaxID=397392 RepID=UPI0025AE7D7E|nr:protein BIG GRAIN 1-like E [Malania oleifera]